MKNKTLSTKKSDTTYIAKMKNAATHYAIHDHMYDMGIFHIHRNIFLSS